MGWLECCILALVAVWLVAVLFRRRRHKKPACGGVCANCAQGCAQKKP